MISSVIADTTPLYGLVDPSDQYHQRAVQELLIIQRLKIKVIIPYPIALESYSLVLYRLGIPIALKFFEEMRNSAILVEPTQNDYYLAWQKVKQYSDQKVTLFDAVTAIISQRLNHPVWTYDHHFDIMGISVWR
jgi:predicted nucleic acid-binding protein